MRMGFGIRKATIGEYVNYSNVSRFTRSESLPNVKKPWVPMWLWNLVSEPDPIQGIADALSRSREQMFKNLAEVVNDKN